MSGTAAAPFNPEPFGKYFLVDRIATGGMAEIFKAKSFSHGGFEQLLVIKRILAHLGANEEFVEMFIDEAKVSVALQHANIIRIYDFGKILDNYFIAMEWLDGKDARNILKKLAKERKFLPIEYAAYIAHEACKGLDYAHGKKDLRGRPYGIVHRDVSPSNILASYEGEVKVADFGIAKAESNAYDTKDGVLKGKFEYMSPEQASGVEIDHRSDIFSLGIILHEMLTGRRLFKTASETQTLETIKNGTVEPPSSIHSRVPEKLDAIVMKALAKNRDQRYQNAREMQEDLAAFLSPQTTDQLRERMGKFMHELFAEDIAEERRRLDHGSEAADKLRKSGSFEGWDGSTGSSMRQTPLPPQSSWALPIAVAAVGMIALASLLGVGIVVIGGVGATAAVNEMQKPVDAPVVVAPAAPTAGTLDVMLMPGGKITLDGAEIGDNGVATIEGVTPGTHQLSVTLDGYEPLTESIDVVAGQTVRFRRTLTAIPKVKGTGGTGKPKNPTPAPLPDPPVVTNDPPPAPAAGPGTVKVSVLGGGWADVYVNGAKQPKTAPSTLSLDPGTYEIRCANSSIGLDQTRPVTVTAGETSKVVCKPE